MSRTRLKTNIGVPSRWRLKHGAWRYRVPEGQEHQWDGKKEFRLGASLAEAYAEWSKRFPAETQDIQTIGKLLERYYREVSSQKAPQSHRNDGRSLKPLMTVFSSVALDAITPQDIYKYIDKRDAKISARREKSMLSHAYTKAVEWGLLIRHPFRGEVRLKGEKARTRYIENWELDEVRAMQPRKKGDPLTVIQAYIELKYMTGLRQTDMLRLREYRGQVGDFIRVMPHKTANTTGKQMDIEVTPALHEVLMRCMAVRPRDIAPWLFCTRRGEPYFCEETDSASGWQSNWQRFMARVLAETKVTERFTEHDIRAKTGSDAESKERAQELLTHEKVGTTMRAYRRKAEKVRPLQ